MKAHTVFRVVKPDKIFRFRKADFPNQRSLYQKAAEGADIVFKKGCPVGRLRDRFIKHQIRVLKKTPMAGVDGSGCGHCAGIGKIIRVKNRLLQLRYIVWCDHGVIIYDQEPVAVCVGQPIHSIGKPAGSAQVLLQALDVKSRAVRPVLCRVRKPLQIRAGAVATVIVHNTHQIGRASSKECVCMYV